MFQLITTCVVSRITPHGQVETQTMAQKQNYTSRTSGYTNNGAETELHLTDKWIHKQWRKNRITPHGQVDTQTMAQKQRIILEFFQELKSKTRNQNALT